jgi:hypothetical protein
MNQQRTDVDRSVMGVPVSAGRSIEPRSDRLHVKARFVVFSPSASVLPVRDITDKPSIN